jgi:putative Holliday junction resolvase
MSSHRSFCGVDYGTKRIGLAISNAEGTIASPLAAVDAAGPPDEVVRRVTDAVTDYDVKGWVVGLPLNMDGTEGPQARLVRTFGERLAAHTRQPVHYWDERLSSDAADSLMARSSLTHKKKKARRDALAAQVILQSFLDAQSGG